MIKKEKEKKVLVATKKATLKLIHTNAVYCNESPYLPITRCYSSWGGTPRLLPVYYDI
jgi:hypothetical protein